MSSNSSDVPVEAVAARRSRKWWMILALPAWVLFGFGLAQALVVGLLLIASRFGLSIAVLDPAIASAIVAVLVYALSLVIAIGLPWWARRWTTSLETLGLTRLPRWMDILLAPAGFIVYMIGSGLLLYVVMQLIPNFDANQVQDTGFSHLSQSYEYILAFVTLVVLAPLAEEVLFRGYLYGKLRRYVPVWLAILVTSVLFGALHGQWNVGLDVFVLSLVLCSLREVTGSIWAGVLLHMCKNGVAYYFLFIAGSQLVQ